MPPAALTKHSVSFEGRLCLLALFLTLSTGKWGSWIGVPKSPFFLIDSIVLSSAALAFVKMIINKVPLRLYSLVLICFMAIQLFRNQEYEIIVRIRDISPFFYLFLTPFLAYALNSVNFATIIKVLRFGTATNMTLFYLSYLNLIAPFDCGTICGTDIFYYRADHVGYVACIGIMAWSAFPKQEIKSWPMVQILFGLLILINQSRAGTLGLILVLFLFLLFQFRRNYQILQIKLRAAVLLVLILPTILLTLNANVIRVTGFDRFTQENVYQQISGNSDGTTRARVVAQGLLLDYVINVKEQYIWGVGPGTEMVLESGAFRYLSNASDVRAPHNWFVGLMARYGIMGLSLWILISIFCYPKRMEKSSGSILVKVSLLNILLFSAVGVMMESPFGALPFAYFLAIGMRYFGSQKDKELINE